MTISMGSVCLSSQHGWIYANEKHSAWQAMENSKYLGKVDSSAIFEMGKIKTLVISTLKVLVLKMMQGTTVLLIYERRQEFVMLTTTGYVSDRMAEIAEMLTVISSNLTTMWRFYEQDLRWCLKQRTYRDLSGSPF